MYESDKYQNKIATTPETVKPSKTLVNSCFHLKFPCKDMNFKQQTLGLNKTRGPCSRKVNMGAAAKMKATVFLQQKPKEPQVLHHSAASLLNLKAM